MNETQNHYTETDTTPMPIMQIERAQIDMQIETAKRFPRSVSRFMGNAMAMIAMDQAIAEECNYILKRKDKGGGIKFIEGPSIRLLEIAASSYQNLRYGSRVIAEDDRFVTCQGVAHDLENNVATSVEVRRRITNRDGVKFSDDMVGVTTNAAGAIARRNALNGVVPRVYIQKLADYAKQIAKGDIRSLPERRQKAFDYFTKVLGVDENRVLFFLEKPSLEDVSLEDLTKLTGLKTALRDGETTIDEAFFQGVKHDRKEPQLEPSMEQPPQPEKRRGRPRGSKNKPSTPEPEDEPPMDDAPEVEKSSWEQLADVVTEAGFTFDQFNQWATREELVAGDHGGFNELSEDFCRRMLRAQQGLINGLKAFVGGAA